MTQLVQMIRRHEKTDRSLDGKLADRPTPEGFANAYRKGIELGEQYGSKGFEIRGVHSGTCRTFQCCTAYLLGAGVALLPNISYSSRLNMISLSEQESDYMRNIKDKEEQYHTIFTRYLKELTAAGSNVADFVISQCENYKMRGMRCKGNLSLSPFPSLNVELSHGSVMDAAYLILSGKEVNFDNAARETGFFPEGEGFDVAFPFQKFNGIYRAEIMLKGKPEIYPLEELRERVIKR
ncbi:MAG: hypothetical protein NT001_07540 [Candidatus Woesearchaeota archaeon]|nr:hypothetical protein [Candidatus Woesearchaeota archaeon]